MLKQFISQKDGSVSLEDYETALDEILRLRERIAALEAAQQSAQADAGDEYDFTDPDQNPWLLSHEEADRWLSQRR